MTPFTLCTATSSGNAHNNHYPNHHQITDQAGLEQVARLDHVAATYTNDRRSSASLISSDCVVMDIDNNHTEESSNWVTSEKLAELMAGVVFMGPDPRKKRPEDQQGHHPPQRRQPHHQVHLGRVADPPSIRPLPGRLQRSHRPTRLGSRHRLACR